jgi:hypothetical protein
MMKKKGVVRTGQAVESIGGAATQVSMITIGSSPIKFIISDGCKTTTTTDFCTGISFELPTFVMSF